MFLKFLTSQLMAPADENAGGSGSSSKGNDSADNRGNDSNRDGADRSGRSRDDGRGGDDDDDLSDDDDDDDDKIDWKKRAEEAEARAEAERAKRKKAVREARNLRSRGRSSDDDDEEDERDDGGRSSSRRRDDDDDDRRDRGRSDSRRRREDDEEDDRRDTRRRSTRDDDDRERDSRRRRDDEDERLSAAKRRADDAEAAAKKAKESARTEKQITRQLRKLNVPDDVIDDIIRLADEDHIEFDEDDGYALDIDEFVASRPRYKEWLKPSRRRETDRNQEEDEPDTNKEKKPVGKFPTFTFKNGRKVALTQDSVDKLSNKEYEEARVEIQKLVAAGRLK